MPVPNKKLIETQLIGKISTSESVRIWTPGVQFWYNLKWLKEIYFFEAY